MSENVVTTRYKYAVSGQESVLAANDAIASSLEKQRQAATALSTQSSGFTPITSFEPVANELKALEAPAKSAASGIGGIGRAAGEMATVANQVIPGLGQVGQSLLSLDPISAATTAAFAVVGLAFNQLQKDAEALQKAADDAARAQAGRAVFDADLSQQMHLIQDGDVAARKKFILDYGSALSDQVQKEAAHTDAIKHLNDAQARQDAAQEIIASGKVNGRDATVDEYTAANLARQQASADIDAYNKTLTDTGRASQEAKDKVQDYYVASQKLGLSQNELNVSLQGITRGSAGAAAAYDELEKKQKDAATAAHTDLTPALKDAGKAAQEASKALGDYQKSSDAATKAESARLDQVLKRKQEDDRAAQEADLNDQIAKAKEQEAAQANADKIVDIRQKAGETESAAVAANQDKADQINQQFMATSLKNLQAYQIAETRADRDHSTERIRKLEDLYNTLTDIAGRRDVAAFVSTRNAGLTDIGRGDQDFGTSAQQRREDFNRQQAEAQTARDKQLADLQASFAKEDAARQTQLNEQIKQTQAAGEVQLKQSDVLQRQLADLRDQWAKADLDARRKSEDAAYQTEITGLLSRRNTAAKVLQSAGQDFVTFAVGVAQTAASLLSGASGGSSTPHSTTAVPQHGFASGIDFVPQDMTARLHRGERVVTAAENAQWSGGQRSQPTVIFQGANFGSVATPSDVERVRTDFRNVLRSYTGRPTIPQGG